MFSPLHVSPVEGPCTFLMLLTVKTGSKEGGFVTTSNQWQKLDTGFLVPVQAGRRKKGGERREGEEEEEEEREERMKRKKKREGGRR